MDNSGSCAIVALLIGKKTALTWQDDMCYVANVGDSRCIMSADGGRMVLALSQDHKPNEEGER